MRTLITDLQGRSRSMFDGLSLSQKLTAIVGGIGLLVACFLLYRWASAPSYQQLYGNLAAEDAAAIVEELDAAGTPYELADGGSTIMVPSDVVYDTRISLSSAGLPTSGSTGYELLDEAGGIAQSKSQEATNYKRAIEGELAATIEAIDGVERAVVKVAIPAQDVFSDDQDKTTASVFVDTEAGTTLTNEQVTAMTTMVSSSVEGLDIKDVTVTDAQGNVLSAGGEALGGVGGNSQSEQVLAFEQRQTTAAQALLDRIVGPGNATVQTTAELNFDSTTTQSREYTVNPDLPALSESEQNETYTGAGDGTQEGIVGPDGQQEEDATGEGATNSYEKNSRTADNAVNTTETQTIVAPGSVERINLAVAVDETALAGRDLGDIEDLMVAGLGINERQGDNVSVQALAFDRSAEEAAAAELAAAEDAEAKAALYSQIKTAALILVIALILLAAWLRSRRKDKARTEATRYVVEQLRQDNTRDDSLELELQEAKALAAPKAPDPAEQARTEIAALVERQPDEVAQLLRGWLVER
jgi:flagellar M-ring protein FliF